MPYSMQSIIARNLASAAAIARRRSEECVPVSPPPLRAEAVPAVPAQVLEARVIDGVFVQAGTSAAAYHRYARRAAEVAEPPAPLGRVVEAWA